MEIKKRGSEYFKGQLNNSLFTYWFSKVIKMIEKEKKNFKIHVPGRSKKGRRKKIVRESGGGGWMTDHSFIVTSR